MRSAHYSVARCLSIRLSVRLSVTRRYSVKMAKHILIFSPLGSHTILVFRHQTLWQYSDLPNGGVECRESDFRPISRFISETIQDRAIVTMEGEQETAPSSSDLERLMT